MEGLQVVIARLQLELQECQRKEAVWQENVETAVAERDGFKHRGELLSQAVEVLKAVEENAPPAEVPL